jgi:hypothetical protein
VQDVKITIGHLTTLKNEGESGAVAFQNDILLSVPQFSYDLFVAIMNNLVSVWNDHSVLDTIWRGTTGLL